MKTKGRIRRTNKGYKTLVAVSFIIFTISILGYSVSYFSIPYFLNIILSSLNLQALSKKHPLFFLHFHTP